MTLLHEAIAPSTAIEKTAQMLPYDFLDDTRPINDTRIDPRAYDFTAGHDPEGDTWENMARSLNAEIPQDDAALDALQDRIDGILKANPNDDSLELVKLIAAYMTGLNMIRPMKPKLTSKDVSELDTVAA